MLERRARHNFCLSQSSSSSMTAIRINCCRIIVKYICVYSNFGRLTAFIIISADSMWYTLNARLPMTESLSHAQKA